LKNRVREADAILFVTPEYNYSIPGVLKNAIDWASRPYGDGAWDGKPVAIMGASAGRLGTARAQYHLRQMMVFLDGRPVNKPEVMIGAAHTKFADGKFTVVGTDKSIALVDLARKSYAPAGWPAEFGVGLEAVGTFTPTRSNFANGCHICEVEVDPDTGGVKIARYIGVDDSGIIINPLLFEGQIHGGLAMGIGQALMEHVAFDDSGQLLSGSFMDYCMPRAEHFSWFDMHDLPDRYRNNPIGVKGAGESGTVGAPPTVINAIVDALRGHGVTDVSMPATPLRVWQAMQAAAH